MKEAHLHLSATEIQLYSVLAPRRKLDLSFGANHSMTYLLLSFEATCSTKLR